MKGLRKLAISIVGGLFVLIGLVFILLPGPSLLLIIPGLFILSYEYPLAKVWLRKCMKIMRNSAKYLDRLFRRKSLR
ncbi:PGPGW domain-containing protein [Glaciecola sp. 2405UD65-10]|uniref:PGPGW domain-containing protein n=1 Tax=Glaciecola sp. 2405UD65-10 TaxID=3397244 RepID=UPI003B5BCDBB